MRKRRKKPPDRVAYTKQLALQATYQQEVMRPTISGFTLHLCAIAHLLQSSQYMHYLTQLYLQQACNNISEFLRIQVYAVVALPSRIRRALIQVTFK